MKASGCAAATAALIDGYCWGTRGDRWRRGRRLTGGGRSCRGCRRRPTGCRTRWRVHVARDHDRALHVRVDGALVVVGAGIPELVLAGGSCRAGVARRERLGAALV